MKILRQRDRKQFSSGFLHHACNLSASAFRMEELRLGVRIASTYLHRGTVVKLDDYGKKCSQGETEPSLALPPESVVQFTRLIW